MIKTIFNVANWDVTLFILETFEDDIYNELLQLNCKNAKEITTKLKNLNVGFTYSDLLNSKSLMIIGIQSDKFQFINTVVHESRHLQQHMAIKNKLNENSEEVCYLMGKIVQIIYKICSINNII